MKKLILGMLAAVVMTAGVSAIDFSAGGGVGLVQIQNSNSDGAFRSLAASPTLGIVGNADFGGWGVQISFDINTRSENVLITDNYTSKESYTDSILALIPYFTFNLGEFTFATGPIMGIDFFSYNYEKKPAVGDKTTIKSSSTYAVFGVNLDARHAIKDHIIGYVNLSVFSQMTSTKQGSYSYNGVASTPSPDYDKWSGFFTALQFAPKIGVVYKF